MCTISCGSLPNKRMPLFQIANRRVIKDGSTTGTYNSTPAVVQTADGDWVISYNVGPNHVSTSYHVLRRSGDQGVTWGPETLQWAGNSPDPTLAKMPRSKDLLVEFGKPNLQGVSGAAYSRSSDNGYTWSKFTFFDNPINNTYFTPALYLIDGIDVYAPGYGPYSGGDGTTDVMIWFSSDDGFTWTKRSTVRQLGDVSINETSLAKIGPTSLLAISRDAAGTHTWGHVSSDMGLTWSSQVDYTPQVGVLHLPQLLQVGNVLLLFGRNPSNNTLVVYSSTDNGITFSNSTVLDTYTGQNIDGGYCWPMLTKNGDVFVIYYADSQGLRLPDIKSLILLMNPQAM